MDEGVSCEVCGLQRKPGLIHARPSKIIKNMTLFICNKCADEGLEPRWMVILGAKLMGMDYVRTYIVKHKYPGSVIEALEIATSLPK